MPLLDLGRHDTSLTIEDLDFSDLAFVYIDNIMPGESQTHLLVESIDAA